MKKNLLLFCGMTSVMLASAQNCSELFISMYVDASGDNKAVEIYNPTSHAIILTGNYQLSMYDNGATAPSISRPLIGTIGAYSTFTFSNGQITADSVHPATGTAYTTPPCDPALQAVANQLDTAHFYSVTYFNGDDALTLDKFEGGTYVPVDVFGCVGEWPISGTGSHVGWWNVSPYNNAPTGKSWTKYHTLIRKYNVLTGITQNPNPGSWNPSVQWDSLPESKTGVSPTYYPQPNAGSTLTNTHFSGCLVNGIQEFTDNVSVKVFPNPSNSGTVNVTAGKPVEMVQVYNLVGELVYQEKMTNPSLWISFSSATLAKGSYLLKSSFAGNQAHVTKIVVQ
jgi:hypothetical protein